MGYYFVLGEGISFVGVNVCNVVESFERVYVVDNYVVLYYNFGFSGYGDCEYKNQGYWKGIDGCGYGIDDDIVFCFEFVGCENDDGVYDGKYEDIVKQL